MSFRMQIVGKFPKQVVWIVAGAIWLSVVGFGMSVLWRYSSVPGKLASPPPSWPADAPVRPVQGRATLLMFAHPNCPCSRASVRELELIMAHSSGKLDAHVSFYKPRGEGHARVETDLWASAKSIPGVSVLEDPDGSFARQAGAQTSGQVLLYDGAGRLIFNGGITAARGHSGDNTGRNAVVTLLQGGTPERSNTPVFGCSLRGE